MPRGHSGLQSTTLGRRTWCSWPCLCGQLQGVKPHACRADTGRRGRAEQREAPGNYLELGAQEEIEVPIREVERRKGLAVYLMGKSGFHKPNCVQIRETRKPAGKSDLVLIILSAQARMHGIQ